MPTRTLKPVAKPDKNTFCRDATSTSATTTLRDKGSCPDMSSTRTNKLGVHASDTDDADDAFSNLASRSKRVGKRARKRKRKQIAMKLRSKKPETCGSDKPPENNEQTSSHRSSFGAGPTSPSRPYISVDAVSLWERDEDSGNAHQYGEHDPLDFYAETHEEQDPAYAVFARTKQRQRREAELDFLEKAQQEARSGLEDLLKTKWSEQDRAFRRQVSKLRSDMAAKQEMQRDQLRLRYKEQTKSDTAKISQGSKWLQDKHQTEIDTAMGMHQQQAVELGQDRAAQAWSQMSRQLQAKHGKEQRQFQAKEAELKKKSEDDYRMQVENLTQHHLKRRREMDQVVQKLEARFRQQQQQQRQHHLRRHEERMKKKREGIMQEYGDVFEKDESDPTSTNTSTRRDEEGTLKPDRKREEADEVRADGRVSLSVSSSRVKSSAGFSDSRHISIVEGRETSDAVLRQKRRKNAMSGTPIQLVVEIHNEGVFVLARGHGFSDGADKHHASSGADTSKHKSGADFIPWGHRARHILHSIVCGEIPDGWCDRIDPGSGGSSKQSSSGGHGGSSGGSGSVLQGGQVKCMVSDMRVSEATASAQRAAAITEVQELRAKAGTADLERKAEHAAALLKKAEELHEKATADEKQCEVAMKKAASDAEKHKQILNAFRAKAAPYFNADGTPSQVTSEENQRKLVQALLKYKSSVQVAEQREQIVRDTYATAKAKAAKASEIAAKCASSRAKGDVSGSDIVDSDGKYRVEDVVAALRLVAERRRKHTNTKKSGDTSWESSLSGLPDALKKSLWQKMQRRRLTIVLRPTWTSVLAEAQSVVKEATLRAASPVPPDMLSTQSSTEKTEEELKSALRSEQLLLLALHPQALSPLPPSVPPALPSDPWAEPGWQVVLDVDQDEPSSCPNTSIFPSTTIGSMFQQVLSGCASAPGRQAAALLKPRHMSMLTAPLSKISEASAPAETLPLRSMVFSEDDLLFSDETMEAGYTFEPKRKPQKRPTVEAENHKSSTAPSIKRRKSGKGAGEMKASTAGTTSDADRSYSKKSQNKKTGQSPPPNSSPPPRAFMKDNQAIAAQTTKEVSTSQKRTGYQPPGIAAAPIPAVAGYGQPGMAEQHAQYQRLMKQRDALQMQQQQQQQQQAQPPQQRVLLQQYHQQQQQQQQQQQMAQMQMLRQQQFQAPPHMQSQPPHMQNQPPHMQSQPPHMQMQFPMQQQAPMQQQPPQPQAPPGAPGFQGPPMVAMQGVSGGTMGQQVPGGAAMPNATGGQHRPVQQPGAARRGRRKDDDMNDPLLMLFNNN